MAEYLGAVWLGHILAEAVLLAALWRARSFANLPCFCWFIAFDLARAAVLLPLWSSRTWTAYGYGYLITEPADMILLSCAGIEAFGLFVRERPTRAAYAAFILPVLIVGIAIPSHQLQSRVDPTWQEVLMNKAFMCRALLTSMPVGLIWGWAWWHDRMPDARTIVLMAFCLFDLVTYFSLAIAPGWVKARPYDGALFVLSGQTACMLAFDFLFTARTRAEEIS